MTDKILDRVAETPIVFTANPLDRAANLRRDHAWFEAQLADPKSRFLPLHRLKVPVLLGHAPELDWHGHGAMRMFIAAGAPLVLLGLDHGVAHFAVDISALEEAPRDGFGKFIDVRSIAPQLDATEAGILAQARSLIDWHNRHRFCPACGARTVTDEAGYSRRCGNDDCKAQHFPRTDPVVIMLVLHGDRCLLGRQPMFPRGMYSALAGFVEPGETFEDAVRREVMEEAGLHTGAVRYVASQPWPFPSSLMIGCQVDARDTAITMDQQELEEAMWFSRAEVRVMLERSQTTQAPRVPPPLSLAHQLAKRWVDES